MSISRPLVVIGHSHSHVVRDAAAKAGVAMDHMTFWEMLDPFLPGDGPRRLRPDIERRLLPPVFAMVAGALHLDLALVEHERPFDFVLPARPDLPVDPNAEILTYGAMLAVLDRMIQQHLATLAAVRVATPGALYYIQPPPVCSHETIPQDDPSFVAFWGEGRRFANVWLRYKVWYLQWEITAAYCIDAGIIVIPIPAASQDDNGFLRACYLGIPGHANTAYGALVLAQIQAIVR